MRMLRPRIFISYAREDSSLAREIRTMLVRLGFIVFLDTEEMIGGEDFVRRLTDEVSRADAVVTLLTPSSAKSEWCQAEWYFAHARGLEVIPIRVGDVEALLPTPIRLLEHRIHFLTATDAEQQKVSAELAEQLARVRRRRRRAALLKLSAAVIILAAGIAAMAWLVSRAAWLTHLRDRTATVARLSSAAQPLAGDDLARAAGPFHGDDVMLGSALWMTVNPAASDAARLNAVMLSSELLRRQKPEARWALRNVKWRNGVIDGGALVNTTFVSGSVERLDVRRATLASVVWAKELTLSNATFTNVSFEAGGFYGTNAIRLDFLDCLFHGVELDLTNFALAKFRSTPTDDAHPNVITAGTVCAFENSVITNRGTAPAAGVMDLSTPADEVQFNGVVFTGVRFRGYMRPEWFKDCSFDRCTLPSSFKIEALEQRGNHVSGSAYADESLD